MIELPDRPLTDQEFQFALGGLKAELKGKMLNIVVYDNPKDDLGYFVARAFYIDKLPVPTKVSFRAKTLEEVQAAIPDEIFHWLPRHPEDDPIIVGVWL